MKHPDIVIRINDEEMRNLIEVVSAHPARDYWLISNGCAIGMTLKIKAGKGKEQDITDYESW